MDTNQRNMLRRISHAASMYLVVSAPIGAQLAYTMHNQVAFILE